MYVRRPSQSSSLSATLSNTLTSEQVRPAFEDFLYLRLEPLRASFSSPPAGFAPALVSGLRAALLEGEPFELAIPLTQSAFIRTAFPNWMADLNLQLKSGLFGTAASGKPDFLQFEWSERGEDGRRLFGTDDAPVGIFHIRAASAPGFDSAAPLYSPFDVRMAISRLWAANEASALFAVPRRGDAGALQLGQTPAPPISSMFGAGYISAQTKALEYFIEIERNVGPASVSELTLGDFHSWLDTERAEPPDAANTLGELKFSYSSISGLFITNNSGGVDPLFDRLRDDFVNSRRFSPSQLPQSAQDLLGILATYTLENQNLQSPDLRLSSQVKMDKCVQSVKAMLDAGEPGLKGCVRQLLMLARLSLADLSDSDPLKQAAYASDSISTFSTLTRLLSIGLSSAGGTGSTQSSISATVPLDLASQNLESVSLSTIYQKLKGGSVLRPFAAEFHNLKVQDIRIREVDVYQQILAKAASELGFPQADCQTASNFMVSLTPKASSLDFTGVFKGSDFDAKVSEVRKKLKDMGAPVSTNSDWLKWLCTNRVLASGPAQILTHDYGGNLDSERLSAVLLAKSTGDAMQVCADLGIEAKDKSQESLRRWVEVMRRMFPDGRMPPTFASSTNERVAPAGFTPEHVMTAFEIMDTLDIPGILFPGQPSSLDNVKSVNLSVSEAKKKDLHKNWRAFTLVYMNTLPGGELATNVPSIRTLNKPLKSQVISINQLASIMEFNFINMGTMLEQNPNASISGFLRSIGYSEAQVSAVKSIHDEIGMDTDGSLRSLHAQYDRNLYGRESGAPTSKPHLIPRDATDTGAILTQGADKSGQPAYYLAKDADFKRFDAWVISRKKSPDSHVELFTHPLVLILESNRIIGLALNTSSKLQVSEMAASQGGSSLSVSASVAIRSTLEGSEKSVENDATSNPNFPKVFALANPLNGAILYSQTVGSSSPADPWKVSLSVFPKKRLEEISDDQITGISEPQALTGVEKDASTPATRYTSYVFSFDLAYSDNYLLFAKSYANPVWDDGETYATRITGSGAIDFPANLSMDMLEKDAGLIFPLKRTIPLKGEVRMRAGGDIGDMPVPLDLGPIYRGRSSTVFPSKVIKNAAGQIDLSQSTNIVYAPLTKGAHAKKAEVVVPSADGKSLVEDDTKVLARSIPVNVAGVYQSLDPARPGFFITDPTQPNGLERTLKRDGDTLTYSFSPEEYLSLSPADQAMLRGIYLQSLLQKNPMMKKKEQEKIQYDALPPVEQAKWRTLIIGDIARDTETKAEYVDTLEPALFKLDFFKDYLGVQTTDTDASLSKLTIFHHGENNIYVDAMVDRDAESTKKFLGTIQNSLYSFTLNGPGTKSLPLLYDGSTHLYDGSILPKDAARPILFELDRDGSAVQRIIPTSEFQNNADYRVYLK